MPKSAKKMVENFRESTSDIKNTIDSIPDELFNAEPDRERWSIAQILEHLYRSEYGLLRLFKGSSQPTDGRDPAEKIAQFKQAFIKSDKKYEAPEQVTPQGEWEREELFEKFYSNRKLVHQMLAEGNLNLDELQLAYEHPFFGLLTGIEWIAFINMHANRHHRQMQDVIAELK